jgi:hypothetical protein
MTAHEHELTASEVDWLDIRSYLREHRRDLDRAAAASYSTTATVRDTPLLTRPNWIPEKPLPLDAIDLELVPNVPGGVGATRDAARASLPTRANGSRYTTYSEAVGELAAPTVFENRPTYRLLDADFAGERARLRFGFGSYFDSLDTGEASAHEFALAQRGRPVEGGLRETITDPCDSAQRPINLAISTLTIRREPDTDTRSFLLHWRDPRKVGHAGGLYQVVPVGIFQPSGYAEWNIDNDFSLWHNITRELAEELGGEDEDYDSERIPIDYRAWPLAARLEQARQDGHVTVHCHGLGVDPLTFVTDLLTTVVIDAPIFDALFGDAITGNAEGRVLDRQPFTPDTVERILAVHPMQAAGAALLRLATNAMH